jgi:predicted NUDIX family NTP pyrophosphohydrolase
MRTSAGILLYRSKGHEPEVFLVHPGGPFWKGKDLGAWSIPKGEYINEEPLAAAKREFKEETGYALTGKFIALTPIKQKAGKLVQAWAVEGDIDADTIVSNSFETEWPPKSGRKQNFPEVDKAAWFTIDHAREKINPAQTAFLDELVLMIT